MIGLFFKKHRARHKTFLSVMLPLAFLAICSVNVRAQYLINPTGGTLLFTADITHINEVSVGRSLGFTGNFFGNPVSTVDVSTNGNLNFDGDSDLFNMPLPDASDTARISSLWTPLTLNADDGSSIIEKQDPGVYYSVTWDNLETFPNSTGRQSFQITWFGAAATIQGFSFLPDDIAFSYQSVGAPFEPDSSNDLGSATIGLDAGDGTNFVPLPGTPDGLITDASLLPINSNSFLLFRPDGQGSYTPSIQQLNASSVPESSTMISFSIGILVVFMLLWKKISSRITIDK